MGRVIALVDMNSFYASCHQAINPELEDKEVIVAGDPEKRTGIVLAAVIRRRQKALKLGCRYGKQKNYARTVTSLNLNFHCI